MSDFDDRLSAVLTAAADDAPHAAGLVQEARRRHVVRRRRRLAAGGVAVALAIVAPVAVLAGNGGGDDQLVGDDQTTTPTWQSVAQDDVRAEIPGDWRKFTCDFDGFTSDVFGPSETDACDFRTYLAFYASASFDPADGPGVITTADGTSNGYVYAGDLAVSVGTDQRDLTRQILATARLDGDPEIAADQWRRVEGVGIRFDMPLRWGLGTDADLRDFGVCVAPGDRNDPPDTERKGTTDRFYYDLSYLAGRWVTVSAPTQAVQALVSASVRTTADAGAVGCAS